MNYHTDTFPGRRISIRGKSYLYFGGTSYLGLQTHADFQKLYIQNVKKYGTNYGASRKSNVRMSIFTEVETTLASLTGSEACTTLSSGYLAGQLVAKHFGSENFNCFYGPNSHSALFQQDSVPFETFNELLHSIRKRDEAKTPVVFLDSIDTTEASYPDFRRLQDLPLNDVVLVVDDSHGMGIMGNQGNGAYEIIKGLKPKELLVCCSLGKGLGLQAGAVFGTKARIDQLTNSSLFGGSSPPAPAVLATLHEGRDIYRRQRSVLKENLNLFLNGMDRNMGFHFIEKHPVFTFKDKRLTNYLKEGGILITNFKYPNNEGAHMSRIVISAAHTKEDIEILTERINSYKN